VGWKRKEAKAQGKRIKTAMAIAHHIVADEEVEKGQLLHVAARDELEAGWRRQDGAWVGVHIPTQGEEETGKMKGKVRRRALTRCTWEQLAQEVLCQAVRGREGVEREVQRWGKRERQGRWLLQRKEVEGRAKSLERKTVSTYIT
jgi:hypothetical protein